MTIRILFFGATADAVGSRSLEFSVDDNSTPAGILDQLNARHPRLSDHRLMFAVNEEHVDGSRRLHDGDQLAIFTPVSGG